jgi:glycosyltransferase involved in cell wall biosynthesis
MLKAIRVLKPRIVLSTFGYVNLALLALRPFLPRGTQIWIREANLPSISLPNNRHHTLTRLGYLLAYRRADHVICSSARMRDELVQVFGVDLARIRILPNPVDEDSIRRLANSVIRSAGKGLRFVAAGRLVRQKGFDRLLKMFAELDVDDAQLSIVGDGPMLGELQGLASALAIGERVSFEGFTDNPWRHMAGADAFLLPSRWEGMPNAVLEALACGVPVIATPESGGIAEIAAETPPGAVTVVEAGQSFVEAMRRILPYDQSSLRPSLLPPRFHLESAVDTFEQWLDESA